MWTITACQKLARWPAMGESWSTYQWYIFYYKKLSNCECKWSFFENEVSYFIFKKVKRSDWLALLNRFTKKDQLSFKESYENTFKFYTQNKNLWILPLHINFYAYKMPIYIFTISTTIIILSVTSNVKRSQKYSKAFAPVSQLLQPYELPLIRTLFSIYYLRIRHAAGAHTYLLHCITPYYYSSH